MMADDMDMDQVAAATAGASEEYEEIREQVGGRGQREAIINERLTSTLPPELN
jgi:hypothetical protein